jgi:hypothetical protein
MEELPPQMLNTVRHVTFSIFHLTIPNIVVWSSIIVILFVAAWLRLPKIFESDSDGKEHQ